MAEENVELNNKLWNVLNKSRPKEISHLKNLLDSIRHEATYKQVMELNGFPVPTIVVKEAISTNILEHLFPQDILKCLTPNTLYSPLPFIGNCKLFAVEEQMCSKKQELSQLGIPLLLPRKDPAFEISNLLDTIAVYKQEVGYDFNLSWSHLLINLTLFFFKDARKKVIIDPFFGLGGTAIAAIDKGFNKIIGIEVMEDKFQISRRKLWNYCQKKFSSNKNKIEQNYNSYFIRTNNFEIKVYHDNSFSFVNNQQIDNALIVSDLPWSCNCTMISNNDLCEPSNQNKIETFFIDLYYTMIKRFDGVYCIDPNDSKYLNCQLDKNNIITAFETDCNSIIISKH